LLEQLIYAGIPGCHIEKDDQVGFVLDGIPSFKKLDESTSRDIFCQGLVFKPLMTKELTGFVMLPEIMSKAFFFSFFNKYFIANSSETMMLTKRL